MIPGFLNTPIPDRMAAWLIKIIIAAALVFIGISYNNEMALVFFFGVTTGVASLMFLRWATKSK